MTTSRELQQRADRYFRSANLWAAASLSAAALSIVGAIVAMALAAGATPTEPAPLFNDNVQLDTSQISEVIEEDDPRWDCRVHGNGICGPTQAPVLER